VILSDYNLPNFSAAEALAVSKNRKLDLPSSSFPAASVKKRRWP